MRMFMFKYDFIQLRVKPAAECFNVAFKDITKIVEQNAENMETLLNSLQSSSGTQATADQLFGLIKQHTQNPSIYSYLEEKLKQVS